MFPLHGAQLRWIPQRRPLQDQEANHTVLAGTLGPSGQKDDCQGARLLHEFHLGRHLGGQARLHGPPTQFFEQTQAQRHRAHRRLPRLPHKEPGRREQMGQEPGLFKLWKVRVRSLSEVGLAGVLERGTEEAD